MSDQGAIEITRESAPWRDRSRPYKVVLDGKVIGSVPDGATFHYELAPGAYELRLKIDFMGSHSIAVDVAPGSTRTLVCRPNGSAASSILDLFSKKRPWIDLHPTD